MKEDISSVMKAHSPSAKRRGDIYSFLMKQGGRAVLVTDLPKLTGILKKDIYYTCNSLIKHRLIKRESLKVQRPLKDGNIKTELRFAVSFIEPWSQKLKPL